MSAIYFITYFFYQISCRVPNWCYFHFLTPLLQVQLWPPTRWCAVCLARQVYLHMHITHSYCWGRGAELLWCECLHSYVVVAVAAPTLLNKTNALLSSYFTLAALWQIARHSRPQQQNFAAHPPFALLPAMLLLLYWKVVRQGSLYLWIQQRERIFQVPWMQHIYIYAPTSSLIFNANWDTTNPNPPAQCTENA